MTSRIAALATYLGPNRNEQGAAVEPALDEVAMAVRVAREAVSRLPCSGPLDAVIFANSGVRLIFPAGAIAIAEALGLSGRAFDITAGCASMGIAVDIGAHMPGSTLVVCADVLSRTIDPTDPTHAPLRTCGDGAAAVVIRHDSGSGPRIVAQRGMALGRWRRFYSSKNGRLVRSLPPEHKPHVSEAYLNSWTQIARELLDLCPGGDRSWLYANHGDPKLFSSLLRTLGLREDRLVRTEHGHAGGADPWIAFELQPPPKGSWAVLLASGIGFTFHGTLLEVR
jgi:3-oxoacyl-[acyl-carrier-protein] synthase III